MPTAELTLDAVLNSFVARLSN